MTKSCPNATDRSIRNPTQAERDRLLTAIRPPEIEDD
jgi:hypothetical protein